MNILTEAATIRQGRIERIESAYQAYVPPELWPFVIPSDPVLALSRLDCGNNLDHRYVIQLPGWGDWKVSFVVRFLVLDTGTMRVCGGPVRFLVPSGHYYTTLAAALSFAPSLLIPRRRTPASRKRIRR
jgi:hypothetical protein